jgi:hypothetical protein
MVSKKLSTKLSTKVSDVNLNLNVPEGSTISRWISNIVPIVILAIDIYILIMLYQMRHSGKKECDCAITWHTKKIMTVITSLIALGLISVIVLVIAISYFIENKNAYVFLPSIILVVGAYCLQLYYSYLLINYSTELKAEKCMCVSDSFKDNIEIYGYTRLILSLLGIMVISTLLCKMTSQ